MKNDQKINWSFLSRSFHIIISKTKDQKMRLFLKRTILNSIHFLPHFPESLCWEKETLLKEG